MHCVICEKTYQHEKDADTASQRSLATEITQEKKLPIETNNDNNTLTQKSTTAADTHTPLSTPPSDRSIKRQKVKPPSHFFFFIFLYLYFLFFIF